MPALGSFLVGLLAVGCAAMREASSHLFQLHISEEALAVSKSAAEDSARWAAEAQSLAALADKDMERRDREFWTSQWRTLEYDALRLQQGLSSKGSGLLQISRQAPKAPSKTSKAKMPAPVAPAGSAGEAADLESKMPNMPKIPAMKGLAGKAMLAPMLGMLKNMYQDQKKRIGDLNKKEEVSKKRFAKQQAKFNEQMKGINDKVALHKISPEFAKNGTAEYERIFKYWQGVRERNHRQFHNALKITHGMMQREKDMISQYERALALPDSVPKSAAPAKPVEAPEVVLEQDRVELVRFCHSALVQIRKELDSAPPREQGASVSAPEHA